MILTTAEYFEIEEIRRRVFADLATIKFGGAISKDDGAKLIAIIDRLLEQWESKE